MYRNQTEITITHAGVELLADNIRSFAAREGTKVSNGATDEHTIHDAEFYVNRFAMSMFTRSHLDTV